MTISGAAKVATTKQEFQELKAAQAKSDIREKFATSGLGDVDPEVTQQLMVIFLVSPVVRLISLDLSRLVLVSATAMLALW